MNSAFAAWGYSKQLLSSKSSREVGGRERGGRTLTTHTRIRAHYEQLSEFERGGIIRLKKAGWANRRIAHHMGRWMRPFEDAAVFVWSSLEATCSRVRCRRHSENCFVAVPLAAP
ncbi:hypothetical protein TNCV_1907631 [Trichonephila clavipes]|nr:hypothetical protein TNCV_1907631 [Trichonephila clavipes]